MDLRTTRTGRLWLDDEGVIHIVATGEPSTADSTAETLGVVRELTAGGKAPILFDVVGGHQVTHHSGCYSSIRSKACAWRAQR